jgi:hypothetical protein
MGLDSVELLVYVEDQFGIEIPDLEAEKIITVGEFAEAVFSKIKLNPSEKCFSQIVFYRLRKALETFNNNKIDIKLDSKIEQLLPNVNLKQEWSELESISNLKLPRLVKLDLNRNAKSEINLFGLSIYKRVEPITEASLAKLVDWTYSLNWKDLTSLEGVSNKYEVERILSGMISEHMGIPINEIELKHSITSDLGIN